MSTLIKLRRDTAANWAAEDPVLQLGEPGYDTTNNELRIGDGTTAWSGLTPIAGGGGGSLPLSNGSSNFNIATSGGNATVATAGTYTWTFDTTGNLTVPNNIVGTNTILIDNRATGNTADIQLFAADDIILQARDRSAGSTSEGGDINLYAGDSAEDGDSSGGDIQLIAGNGGAGNVDFGGSGGFITIRSGDGGPAIGNSGGTAESGGSITISAGDAGDNNGNIDLGADGGDVFIESGFSTGNTNTGGDIYLTTGTGGQNGTSGKVQIIIPSYGNTAGGTWTFGPTGNLTLPAGTPSINYANGAPYGAAPVNTGNLAFDQSTITSDQSNAYINFNAFDAGDIDVGTNNAKNVVIRTDAANVNNAWTFDATGVLTLPGGSEIDNDGATIEMRAVNNINLEAGDVVNIYSGNGDYQWQFDDAGNLVVPPGGAIITPPGSSGNIIMHPDDGASVIIQGGATTLLRLTSDAPDTQNRIEIDTYGANLGQNGGGTFNGAYLRTNGPTQTDDKLATFAGKGTANGSTLRDVTSVRITLDAAANWSVGNTPTHISFFTTPIGGNTVQEQVRIGPAGNVFLYNGSVVAGNGVVQTGVFTASTLPTGGATVGERAFVSDADSRTWGNIVVGGAGNTVPVWSDGTNWYIG